MMRVGVLASGSGSNFQALVDGLRGDASITVAALVGNVPSAGVFARADKLHVPAVLMDHTKWPSREAFDEALVAELKLREIDLVCLAGYLRLVTPVFLRAFTGRVINIHPALLPSFPGLHAIRRALEAGVRVTGCTVHFVDEGTDTGPIIAQAAVPVMPGDDAVALAARVQVQEHRLFPRVVKAIARGDVRLEGRAVRFKEWIG
jgi:phosphoribosylglycinamide formyltransferase-1